MKYQVGELVKYTYDKPKIGKVIANDDDAYLVILNTNDTLYRHFWTYPCYFTHSRLYYLGLYYPRYFQYQFGCVICRHEDLEPISVEDPFI